MPRPERPSPFNGKALLRLLVREPISRDNT